MPAHDFLLTSENWMGQGKITFTLSPTQLRFYTKWQIENPGSKAIYCQQHVEMEGREEALCNRFTISNVGAESFDIELTNELLGTIQGKGVINAKTIAWEFRGNPDFEGFEVYELQENGDYMLHAEYIATDQYRTIIDGRIWKKST